MEEETLFPLLERCTVYVVDPATGEQGTGCFVAPGQVLTCAHVVKGAAEQQTSVQVFWQEDPESAFLSTQAEMQGFRPEADLALLKVQASWVHPCVWLGETVEPFQALYSYSYPPDRETPFQLDSQGTSTTLKSEGWTHVGAERLLKLKDGQVKPGMSGAPLLNVDTGTVCGLIAWTREASSALGGRAVLTQTIWRIFPDLQTAQRRWKGQDERWRAAHRHTLALSSRNGIGTIGNTENPLQPLSPNRPTVSMGRPSLKMLTRIRALSAKEKEQLVDALLVLRTMRERTSRDRVVQELSFSDSIRRDSNTTNKEDVMSIVSRCLEFPDGLYQLFERIQHREENSLPLEHLSRFLEILFSSPHSITINIYSLAELYKLSATVQIAKAELHNLYRQSASSHKLPTNHKFEEGELLLLMIQELAQESLQKRPDQQNLTHPLLTFVKLLSQELPDAMSTLLLEWLEATAEKENIILAEEDTLDNTMMYSNDAPYYLLVKITPEDERNEAFGVFVWFICEQNGKTVSVHGEANEQVKLEELPALLDELIMKCEAYTDIFTIELFLPFNMLQNEKIDAHRWRLDEGFGNTRAVSHKYPLVLRSYDRIYGMNNLHEELKRRLRRNWESNWDLYNQCGEAVMQKPLREEDSYNDNLVALLHDSACLTMLFTPPTFDEAKPHIFKKMLSAGTSVALWPRQISNDLNELALERAYQNLLEGCHCSTLPKKIWEKRKEALKEETSPANHLTLFWDNPFRLPSDAPNAPVQEKYPLAYPQERK